MATRPRDSQWSKVLRAEKAAIRQLELPSLNRGEIEDIVYELEKSRWMRTKQPKFRSYPLTNHGLKVLGGRSRHPLWCIDQDSAGFHSDSWYVQLHPTTQYTAAHDPGSSHYAAHLHVIHAVLHYVIPLHQAQHGPEFCRLYIQTTRQFLGKDAAKVLEEKLRLERCKTRVVSEEARAKARFRAQGRDLQRQRDNEPNPLTPKKSKKAADLASMRDRLNQGDSS